MTYEWRYYYDGCAWLCKVVKKKKTIVWMSAWNGFVKATIYYPLSKLDDVMDLDIKNKTKSIIKETRNVGKSKPCMFEFKDDKMIADFEQVMLCKISCK